MYVRMCTCLRRSLSAFSTACSSRWISLASRLMCRCNHHKVRRRPPIQFMHIHPAIPNCYTTHCAARRMLSISCVFSRSRAWNLRRSASILCSRSIFCRFIPAISSFSCSLSIGGSGCA